MKKWVLKVQSQHRLRLSSDVFEFIPWLAKAEESVVAIAIPGEQGELRLIPGSSREGEKFEKIIQLLSQRELKQRANEDERATDLSWARYFINSTPLTFTMEENRITVVMPKELRDLNLAPSKGEYALIFLFGSQLEIWRGADWKEHYRKTGENVVNLIDECADEIGLK